MTQMLLKKPEQEEINGITNMRTRVMRELKLVRMAENNELKVKVKKK